MAHTTLDTALDTALRVARRRPVTSACLFLLVLVFVWTAHAMTKSPRTDRDWVAHLVDLPNVVSAGDQGPGSNIWSIAPVRAWSYAAEGPVETDAISAAFSLLDIQRVWFVVEPHPSLDRLMAHTLVLFELPGDRLIGLTIEARREADEKYDPLAGVWNSYELAYIWASAKDLLTRRAVYLDHQIHIYPVDISPVERRAFARSLLEKSRDLKQSPRFYNTLFSNCTNELAKTAGLGWSPAFVLTARSARRLFDEGLIDGVRFDRVSALARVGGVVKALNEEDRATFDAALLAELRRRADEMQRN